FQAEDGIRDFHVTGVQTCALPILDHVHAYVVIGKGDAAVDHEDLPVLLQREAVHPDLAQATERNEAHAREAFRALAPTERGGVRSEERRVGKGRHLPWGRGSKAMK